MGKRGRQKLFKKIARRMLSAEISSLLDRMSNGDKEAEVILRKKSQKSAEFKALMEMGIAAKLARPHYATVNEAQIDARGMRPIRK